MALCRFGYLLALLAAGLFFICFSGWFSLYILVLALAFPLFSLLVSLPGMLGLKGRLVLPRTIRRGGTAVLELRLESRWKLPVARVRAEIRCTNSLTGEALTFRKRASGGARGMSVKAGVESKHCGRVVCSVKRIKVYDLLGLFTLRRPVPAAAEMAVLPLELPAEPVPALLGAEKNVVMKPRPGGGPGEDYDLRPYRAGDPLRSVHWKLSSKLDDLVVRETLEPHKTAVVLTYDHFGAPDALDAVFERLDAVSRALLEAERPYYIQWADPASGRLHTHFISSVKDLRAFQWTAFATPAPPEGRTLSHAQARLEGVDGPVRRYHVQAGEGGGGA